MIFFYKVVSLGLVFSVEVIFPTSQYFLTRFVSLGLVFYEVIFLTSGLILYEVIFLTSVFFTRFAP